MTKQFLAPISVALIFIGGCSTASTPSEHDHRTHKLGSASTMGSNPCAAGMSSSGSESCPKTSSAVHDHGDTKGVAQGAPTPSEQCEAAVQENSSTGCVKDAAGTGAHNHAAKKAAGG
jgi:hypothetical protein